MTITWLDEPHADVGATTAVVAVSAQRWRESGAQFSLIPGSGGDELAQGTTDDGATFFSVKLEPEYEGLAKLLVPDPEESRAVRGFKLLVDLAQCGLIDVENDVLEHSLGAQTPVAQANADALEAKVESLGHRVAALEQDSGTAAPAWFRWVTHGTHLQTESGETPMGLTFVPRGASQFPELGTESRPTDPWSKEGEFTDVKYFESAGPSGEMKYVSYISPGWEASRRRYGFRKPLSIKIEPLKRGSSEPKGIIDVVGLDSEDDPAPDTKGSGPREGRRRS